MSDLTEYMRSRGLSVVENEFGFCTYEEQKDHLGNRVVYIADIFIKEEYRQSNHASKLADKVAEIAKKKDIKYLLGSTDLNRPNIELSFKSQMGYGFKVHSYHENMIYWIKEIN